MPPEALGRVMDRYEIDQSIVEVITVNPDVTIDGIAKATGLSYTAVRNSLRRLVSLGVVTETTESSGPSRRGRPATYFRIDQGLQLFIPPRQFQQLALTIVEQLIKEEGTEHVGDLLNRAAKLQVQRMAVKWNEEKTTPKTLKQVVEAICQYINEQGCYARFRSFDKGYYIHVGNCVYQGIATSYPGTICRYHESLILNICEFHDTSLKVTHEEAIAKGAQQCSYAIIKS